MESDNNNNNNNENENENNENYIIDNNNNNSLLYDDSVDMISIAQDVLVLLPQYENATLPDFLLGINHLSKKYSKLRKVRGDGNCFYRAFLFGYLECLLIKYKQDILNDSADIERKRILDIIINSKNELIEYGYNEIAFESFYDVVIEVLENLFNYTLDELLDSFQASGLSDYYTWYMRLLTSLNMKKNQEKYLPFIDDGTNDMNSYCLREVEPMGKEVEEIQITALTEYLGIKTKIEYLDGKPFDNELSFVTFNVNDLNKDTQFDVHLLYRPGHYDIIYL